MTGTPVNDYEADPEWQAARNWWAADSGINATERHHVRREAIYAMHRVERASEADPGWEPRPQLELTEVHDAARCKALRPAEVTAEPGEPAAETEALIAGVEALLADLAEHADRGSSTHSRLTAAYEGAHARLTDRLTAYRAAAG
jgi:hypothetical protein